MSRARGYGWDAWHEPRRQRLHVFHGGHVRHERSDRQSQGDLSQPIPARGPKARQAQVGRAYAGRNDHAGNVDAG